MSQGSETPSTTTTSTPAEGSLSWAVKCQGSNTRVWKGWLKQNGFHWYPAESCWVLGSLDEVAKDWILEQIQATCRGEFDVYAGQGSFEIEEHSRVAQAKTLKSEKERISLEVEAKYNLKLEKAKLKQAAKVKALKGYIKELETERDKLRQQVTDLTGSQSEEEDREWILKRAQEIIAEMSPQELQERGNSDA